jgi:6-phosphogluconate dehydrogenase (decarboxylating)
MSRNITSSTSTCRLLRKCGGTAPWSVRGCSTSPRRRWQAIRTLEKFDGRVSDSGEGRWTLKAAIDTGVPAPVLSAALFDRFSSRGNAEFADKMQSAMRYAFGGHLEKPKE